MENIEKTNFEAILKSIGGWGKYQIRTYIILCLVAIFAAFHMNFIFVARDIKYRCRIENCEDEMEEYNPEWLKNAVPYTNDVPNRCLFYEHISSENCSYFNKNVTKTCHDYIYERNQITIVQDFNITCDNNLWKLTLVGSVNSLGTLVGFFFVGYFSDRFGRKRVLIIAIIFTTILGIAKAFSPWYAFYVILEFIALVLGVGVYSTAFILALEIVDVKRRSLANIFMALSFVTGQVLLGLAAWKTHSWTILLQVIHAPGFVLLLLLWYVSESVRWLFSKNRTEEAKQILNSIAKLNKGVELDSEILDRVFEQVPRKAVPLLQIFKSKILLLRTILCALTWLFSALSYYGVMIYSVELSENFYIDFIATALVEIPAIVVIQFVINYFGRRKTLGVSLILGGLACIVDAAVQEGKWVSLAIFLTAKFFISLGYATLHVLALEMFPTNLRHSLVSFCNTVGCVGGLLAAQVPLMARLSKSLPLIIFAIMCVTSGIIAFWFPETMDSELPNEIIEAENLMNRKR